MNLFTLKRIFLTLFTLLLLAIWMLPVFWMVSSSFKTEKDIISLKWLPSKAKLDNYTVILEKAKIGRWFLNSVVVSVSATIGVVMLSVLAGYALAKIEFPGRQFLFFFTLAGFMIPIQSIMIPIFLLLHDLKLLNSYAAIILPGLTSSISVLIIAQYFKGIDREYEEAARLDGASELQILFRIMTPMAIPAIATITILNFTGAWNDFLWPLIAAQTDKMYTLPVGIYNLANSDTNIRFGPVMAANVISTLPVLLLFFIFQKYLVKGVTVGELK
jgi:ABC-type glycerol-3-phosphate transport system permease component